MGVFVAVLVSVFVGKGVTPHGFTRVVTAIDVFLEKGNAVSRLALLSMVTEQVLTVPIQVTGSLVPTGIFPRFQRIWPPTSWQLPPPPLQELKVMPAGTVSLSTAPIRVVASCVIVTLSK